MSENKQLQFSTGLVTYKVNDKCEISFAPTDAYFAERVFAAFNRMHDQQKKRQELGVQNLSGVEVFELHKQIEKEAREIIDDVFEQPVCEDIFGKHSVYTLSNGLPQWLNFMLAIIDEIDSTITKEKKATNPRISKYMAKYHR